MEKDNSARRVPKATYQSIPVRLPDTQSGRAIAKFNLLSSLALQPGEVAGVRAAMTGSTGLTTKAWSTLTAFEGVPLPSLVPPAAALARIPSDALVAFGHKVAQLRQQALAKATQSMAPATNPSTRRARPSAGLAIRSASGVGGELGGLLNSINGAVQATQNFEGAITATPIGMLNLERLEMIPAGVERGDLVASIPLAPLEKTSVVQKEWSVTTQDFSSIVTDSLDKYSETGVTENTDLAQSTDSQTQHSNQFNVNATVSGSYGLVTATLSTGATLSEQVSNSEKDSRNHAVTTTRKASARTRQEHKTTISISTVTGTSETTARELQNPSATDPIRIDYFSLMRKWHVSLYRYGLRLTYDIGIPEPGGTMREAYRTLDLLQKAAGAPFSFDVKYSDITPLTYQDLASQYGAQVAPPPGPGNPITVSGPTDGLADDNDSWHFFTAPFSVSEGYEISGINVQAMMNVNAKGNSDNNGQHHFMVLGTDLNDTSGQPAYLEPLTVGGNPYMAGFSGSQSITYFMQWVGIATVEFLVATVPTAQNMGQWVASVWNGLYNAAQSAYYARQQALSADLTALQAQLENVDTLTLRREESDEIMKGILHWLLGPTFDFMPPAVQAVFLKEMTAEASAAAGGLGIDAVQQLIASDLDYGIAFTSNDLSLDSSDWTAMYRYQEMIKFINEAIEWENVVYFLYSYFWDVPPAWDFIRAIRHSDATRQAFLRAGSARVVLTVRQGWEQAWVSFVENGGFDTVLDPNHPYMTIAQEIQNFDNTNYPGIPPANAGGPALADGAAAACSSLLPASPGPASIPVDSSSGFAVGGKAIIDTAASGLQEIQVITAVPDATHVTVDKLDKAHDGSSNTFPVVQAGEKGVLIADWYEYTPTSAIDIAVTSNLTTIA